jgi:CRISP-associated protein Cas1
LKRIGARLLAEHPVDVLRGLEGEAAQAYFGVLDHLIRVPDAQCASAGAAGARPPMRRMRCCPFSTPC